MGSMDVSRTYEDG
jgi:hypothetical protein